MTVVGRVKIATLLTRNRPVVPTRPGYASAPGVTLAVLPRRAVRKVIGLTRLEDAAGVRVHD